MNSVRLLDRYAMWVAALMVMALATAPTVAKSDPLEELGQAEISERSEGDSDAAFANRLDVIYQRGFSIALELSDLNSMPGSLLEKRLEAANLVAFHASGLTLRNRVADQLLLFNELHRRGVATESQARSLSDRLLEARDWESAADLSDRFPAWRLASPPPLIDARQSQGRPSHLRFDAGGGSLIQASFAAFDGPRVIVVSHPQCHFSQRAFAALFTDPELAGALQGRATWLSPVSSGLDLESLARWNPDHPDGHFVLAFDQSEWSMIDEWSTPIFYFLQGDRVVRKVAGWPEEGRSCEVRAGLVELGLLGGAPDRRDSCVD